MRWKPLLWVPGILAVFLYGPMIAIEGWCIGGRSGWSVAGVEFFIFIPGFAFLIVGAALLVLLFSRDKRGPGHVALGAGFFIALFLPALWAADSLRSLGFWLAAKRAEPLVKAIRAYEAVNGRPPEDLHDLVPAQLPCIPEKLPPLRIESGPECIRTYHGNRWVLVAEVPSGLLNWDQFLYFPNGKYPEYDYGGSLEPIRDWAYVHE